MAVTYVNTTGLVLGLTAETGIDAEKASFKFEADEVMRKNVTGEDTGFAIRNQRVNIDISGAYSGATGLTAATLGATVTIANMTGAGLFGVSTGGTYVKSGSIDRDYDWQKFGLNAVRNINIT